MFALMSSVVGFAQLSEVKGVETKVVIYDGPEYRAAYDKNSYSFKYHSSTKWFGFSFYNMNSISVSVEAELYQEDNGKMVATKSFNLKPNETYIWKHENRGDHFKVNAREDGASTAWTDSKKEPAIYSSYGYILDTYYVKYKAYKIL